MPATIRPATAADLPKIQAVATEAWMATYQGLIAPEDIAWFLDRAYAISSLERSLASLGAGMIVAIQGEQMVGYAMAGPNRDRIAELFAIYVLPGFQERGIGFALWNQAITHVWELGFGRIMLWVLTSNLKARRFYERQGATVFGEQEVTLGDSRINETSYDYMLVAPQATTSNERELDGDRR